MYLLPIFRRVSWCGISGQGFSLEYTGIAVHAVCKDTSKFPHECIYCMLDSSMNGENTVLNI